MTFHVGQRVVCVDDSFGPRGSLFLDADGKPKISSGNSGGLQAGQIYTIQAIEAARTTDVVHLVEIRRPPSETGFYARRFRPVVERKTDISIFTAMLNPSRMKERA